MEDREARRRAEVLLARQTNSMHTLVAPADVPTPHQASEDSVEGLAGAGVGVGHPLNGTGRLVRADKRWLRRMFGS